jgi:hypothetical protein
MGNILENVLTNLGLSDSDLNTNWEDEDENGMNGILPSSPDSNCMH